MTSAPHASKINLKKTADLNFILVTPVLTFNDVRGGGGGGGNGGRRRLRGHGGLGGAECSRRVCGAAAARHEANLRQTEDDGTGDDCLHSQRTMGHALVRCLVAGPRFFGAFDTGGWTRTRGTDTRERKMRRSRVRR